MPGTLARTSMTRLRTPAGDGEAPDAARRRRRRRRARSPSSSSIGTPRSVARHTIPTAVGEPDEAADQIAAAIDGGTRVCRRDARGRGGRRRRRPRPRRHRDRRRLARRQPRLARPSAARPARGRPRRSRARSRTTSGPRPPGSSTRRLLGDVEDLVYLSVGTGISAGVVLDGRLHRGTRGLAGEIGHVVVDADGPVCACGLARLLRGRSRPARPIAARGERGDRGGTASTLAAGDRRTRRRRLRGAAGGDSLAADIVGRAGESLAQGDPRARHDLRRRPGRARRRRQPRPATRSSTRSFASSTRCAPRPSSPPRCSRPTSSPSRPDGGEAGTLGRHQRRAGPRDQAQSRRWSHAKPTPDGSGTHAAGTSLAARQDKSRRRSRT